jgi:hypothetical protein
MQIPNNNVSVQVAQLKSGQLVMVFNGTRGTTTRGKPGRAGRVPVSIALSEDEGKIRVGPESRPNTTALVPE